MAGGRLARLEFEAPDGSSIKRSPSLAAQAHRRLKTLFMLGEMEPGRRLTYREVADQLGVSVTPAREALFKLVAERIFDLEPSGVISVPDLTAEACGELWRIRLLLEGHCAEIAAERATPALIKQMEKAHRLMADAKQARRLRDGMRHNLAFHFLLYREARSPILLALIEDIWARSAAYVRFFHSRHVEQRNEAAAQGPHMHTTIVGALRTGDAARVRNGIERDLLEVRDGILNLLKQREDREVQPKAAAPHTRQRPARPKRIRAQGVGR